MQSGKATRRKRFKFFTLNIYCFYTFKNIREQGRNQTFSFGGPLEGPVLQQGELSMVCVGISERDLILGGQAKFWEGSAPPWHTPSSAPVCECQRGNASKAIDHCNIAIVSRDLSRLRTSRATMLCGKELVNTCVRAEVDLFCRHPTTSYTGLMRPVSVNASKA